ncbi:type I restriction-modification system subunit M [Lactococcus lactis subsp. lactis]|uniref:type I restriction-modification system subunit M n=1 Tax=Lactococcus lactis TaxID=1358 RepID=UPI000200CCE2|nr:type I restriction-modification system subunit M [Lactococcus lactis]ADZ63271.1 type I restriction-modification system, M subunit [Lactococcus lactis subsp. lactis CV56]KAF0952282.1 type I restriction-modification system subunit M [Lactococcus lactis subsp. lactis]KSU30205.1 Type I restriction-modification system DNA-methyltransferase subunit M [Lactococcus lactis subsp. lactis]MBN2936487.1 type I restriction-modification system subunit M [Lactococcus lactis]QQB12141.1 type I restriction-mo
MTTSEEIKKRLWDGATELRGSMDASRYKDYMLGLMFYKFLSDKTLETFRNTAGLGRISESDLVEEYTQNREDLGEELDKMIQQVLGYFVAPEYLYQKWIKDINTGDFEVQKVTDSLNSFEKTIAVTGESADFKGLFSSSTLDLTDTALGSNLNERSKNIKALINLFADLDMVALQKSDVLGDAYEYLIGQFAMESGKKAGEFYTPRQVSEVMAQIVAKTSNIQSIYDPTVGSGSLLLTVGKHLSKEVQKDLSYYGQEKNTATYNLTRMNLLLHGVRPEKMTVRNADTLSHDWPEDPSRPNVGVQFDAVVMNPPYSLKDWNKAGLKISDPRFEIAGTLPPDSKGDFAFLLHGLFHLGTNGTMAIVLPHGVLFRGGSEGDIRQRLLDKNQIDTIIGLPSGMFTNTGIPVIVMILKKNRPVGEPVLVIDASRSFIKVGKQNVLQEKDIAKIVDTYSSRREIEGYSYLATHKEIIANEWNMNIPRYVEADNDEIAQDVDAHLYGGIPKSNIDELLVLNKSVPEVIRSSFEVLRDGYLVLNKSIEQLTEEVNNAPQVLAKNEELRKIAESFVAKYWDILRQVNLDSDLASLMSEMLSEIKEEVSSIEFVDAYSAYQIVAEIWKDNLTKDSELIAASDFYTVGRTREPNMVTKGSGKNKRQEQDGWIGTLVPNGLIAKRLFASEQEEIEELKNKAQEIDSELSELVEAAKVEDSEEYEALYESIKKNEDDEPQDTFEAKTIKAELKRSEKGTSEFEWLKRVEKLLADKSSTNKSVKEKEKQLKEAVESKIENLTNEEIDMLVFEKWFAGTVDALVGLVEKPLRAELSTIALLEKRYAQTFNEIDAQVSELEKAFEALASELVVNQ